MLITISLTLVKINDKRLSASLYNSHINMRFSFALKVICTEGQPYKKNQLF